MTHRHTARMALSQVGLKHVQYMADNIMGIIMLPMLQHLCLGISRWCVNLQWLKPCKSSLPWGGGVFEQPTLMLYTASHVHTVALLVNPAS